MSEIRMWPGHIFRVTWEVVIQILWDGKEEEGVWAYMNNIGCLDGRYPK
jgi:hypothetical protein